MNVDGHLAAALESSGSWTESAAVENACRAGELVGAVLERDEGAGEWWVRLLRGEAVIAYVCVGLPLAIVARDSGAADGFEAEMQMIRVESMASAELSGGEAMLKAAFGDSPRLDSLMGTPFSADDLWYATV